MSQTPERSAPEPGGTKTLTRRFFSSSMINIMIMVTRMGLRLAGNLILTRLLMPEVFGLMAFALLIQTGAQMLSDIGVERSIMRDEDAETERYLSTAWTVRILRSGAITILMILFGLFALPILGQFAPETSVMAAPEAGWVVCIIGLFPLMLALGSVNEYVAYRRLEVGRVFVLDVVTQLIGMVLLVIAVWIWPVVWSLAIGTIFNAAVRSAATHFFLPGPRAKLGWDKEISQRLWYYGKWLIGSSTFGFIASQGERLILAALLETAVFGLYSIARLWAEAAQSLLGRALNAAGVPALSEIMRDPDRDLHRPFNRLQRWVDVIVIVGFLGYYLISGPFIHMIYPPAYEGAAYYAPFFCLLFLRMRFFVFDALLMSSGQTRTLMSMSAQVAFVVLVGVWITMSNFGIKATIVMYCFAQLCNVPTLLLAARQNLPERNMTLDWFWFGACVVLCGLAVFAW